MGFNGSSHYVSFTRTPPSAIRVTVSVRKKAFSAILWGEGVEVLGRATKFGGELWGLSSDGHPCFKEFGLMGPKLWAAKERAPSRPIGLHGENFQLLLISQQRVFP